MRSRERSSRENQRFSSVEKRLEDFFHGLLAGCGQTACVIAWMRSRERSSRENQRFSSVEKRLEDFFHGL